MKACRQANLFAIVMSVWAFVSLGHAEAIHNAANTGDVTKVKQLLAEGVDVNVAVQENDPGGQMHGQTPLHCAARSGSKEVVELLLAKGAAVNARVLGEIHRYGTRFSTVVR